MRKWMRDRMRRRKTSAPPAGQTGGEDQALQPVYPEPGNAPAEASAPAVPEGETQPREAGGEAAGQGRSRSRSRRRRGGKKPAGAATAPGERRPAPLRPAYSESEGPRATMVAPFTPGAPTGEAAELGELPEEEPPARPRDTAAAAPAVHRTPKGAVILSVGLPGSGKTTWFKRHGVTPLSSDLLRSLLFDDPTEQRHQDLVFSSLRSLLRARLMARMPQNYVDATNLSPKERRHWIRMARDFGYEVHAVYFDVPLETCMERNRRRQRVVPEDVMQRMSAKLRPPAFEEGFSKIIVVRVKNRASDAGADPSALIEPPERELDE